MSKRGVGDIYFEDLEIGRTFSSPEVTITACEVDIYSFLTGHAHPIDNARNIHINSDYARSLGLKDRVVPGLQLVSYTTKLAGLIGLWGRVLLFLGLDSIRFLHPVFPDDRVRLDIEVVDRREADKWPDRGVVTFRYVMKNQEDKVVLTGEASYQFLKRVAG